MAKSGRLMSCFIVLLALLANSCPAQADPGKDLFDKQCASCHSIGGGDGGWISDKLGGARVTFWTFIAMVLAVVGVLNFIPHADQGGSFQGFLIMFLLLFALTGVGNASTFRMIPVIYMTEHQRAAAGRSDAQINIDAAKEAAAALGFAGALGAYGGFFIPKSFGTSIAATGGPDAALYGFIIFYLSCIIMTWWYYSRKNAEMPC